jgi:hypothetical protein
MVLRGLLILLPLMVVVPDMHAQSSSDYEVRRFDPDRLEKYRNDPRFQYRRDAPVEPKVKPKKKDKAQRRKTRAPLVRNTGAGSLGAIGKVVLWVLIIGAGLFLILGILKVRFRKLVKKKSDEAEVLYTGELEEDEDIRDMEFESLLDKAISEKRYRYAVRLLYLQSLRQLHEGGIIRWTIDKTNHEYVREVRDGALKPIFSEVTFIFEYIWYGEFPVDKDHFYTARGSFVRLEQAMRREHAE